MFISFEYESNDYAVQNNLEEVPVFLVDVLHQRGRIQRITIYNKDNHMRLIHMDALSAKDRESILDKANYEIDMKRGSEKNDDFYFELARDLVRLEEEIENEANQ